MHKSSTFLGLLAFILSSIALAHGEDKLGPNKGYIRMPGPFHTELVPQGNESIRVYLLDMNWKNPTTEKSSLTVKIAAANKTTDLSCSAQKNYFECKLPKGTSLASGFIEVNADRGGVKGNTATYSLPLKLEQSGGSGHEGHH